ncbi:hypothetical protein L7F22_054408 [Adiantum nelumboides]|nr:hypothetical protein [Adiantum nelumboides]
MQLLFILQHAAPGGTLKPGYLIGLEALLFVMGAVYGLQNMGSPWKSRWRLVYAKLDELYCKEVWCFIILNLDLTTLEWSGAARMPPAFFRHFGCIADSKICGGGGSVYFSSKVTSKLFVCHFSDGEAIWRWVGDCPVYNYQNMFLCKGFPFEPQLDCSP